MRLEAVHAARQTVVWNTNDITITNRSHTNNVAIETYMPGRNEQEFRESNSFEVLPTLYRSQIHRMMLLGSKTVFQGRHSCCCLQE